MRGIWNIIIVAAVYTAAASGSDLNKALEQVRVQNGLVGLSVVTACKGLIQEVFNSGVSEISSNKKVNDLTRFRIASISKHVTSIGIMKLWEQGFFELDEDVSSYLGFNLRNPHYPDAPITFRQLLSHQSSLTEGSMYDGFLSETYNAEAVFPTVHDLLVPGGKWYSPSVWQKRAPGSYFSYSNVNFGLLGTLIEAITGERFDIYQRDNILRPLGIFGSYNIQDIEDIENLAVLYRDSVAQTDDFRGIKPAPRNLANYKIGTNGFIFGAQGGLRVSALELSKILLILQGKGSFDQTKLLQPSTVDQMFEAQWLNNGTNGDTDGSLFQSWGLGVHRITSKQGADVIFPGQHMFGHAGDAYGLISDMFTSTELNYGFVAITNGYSKGSAYKHGNHSSFMQFEEQIFEALKTLSLPLCSQNVEIQE